MSKRYVDATRLTRIVVDKLQRDSGQKRDFWSENPVEATPRPPDSIAIPKSPPSRPRKSLYQIPMLSIGVLCLALSSMVIVKPDLFRFLSYHNIYRTLSPIFLGEDQREQLPSITIVSKPRPEITERFDEESERSSLGNSRRSHQVEQVSAGSGETGAERANAIQLGGKVFSWKDDKGILHFSNTNYPLDNPTLKVQTELNHYSDVTRITAENNAIYLPVTLRHRGAYYTTKMLLDTGASHTVIPSHIAKRLLLSNGTRVSATLADGSKIAAYKNRIDLLSVGPFRHRSFNVSINNRTGNKNSGILGMDFLKRHPFKIDYQKRLIVWM